MKDSATKLSLLSVSLEKVNSNDVIQVFCDSNQNRYLLGPSL